MIEFKQDILPFVLVVIFAPAIAGISLYIFNLAYGPCESDVCAFMQPLIATALSGILSQLLVKFITNKYMNDREVN